MNLRIQSGVTFPAPTLDAFIQSHSGFPPAGEPACVLPTSTASCIFLPAWNCNSNSLLAHQLKRSLGRVNLWKQVQNHLKPVDFTGTGAQIAGTLIVELTSVQI